MSAWSTIPSRSRLYPFAKQIRLRKKGCESKGVIKFQFLKVVIERQGLACNSDRPERTDALPANSEDSGPVKKGVVGHVPHDVSRVRYFPIARRICPRDVRFENRCERDLRGVRKKVKSCSDRVSIARSLGESRAHLPVVLKFPVRPKLDLKFPGREGISSLTPSLSEQAESSGRLRV